MNGEDGFILLLAEIFEGMFIRATFFMRESILMSFFNRYYESVSIFDEEK